MGKGENSKKVAGNARKAAAAAEKEAAAQAKKDAEEAKKWGKGAKDDSKREAAEAKKREAAAKKAEKELLLKQEEATLKTMKQNPKAGSKKSVPAPLPKRGLDAALASLDAPADSKVAPALHASGIDDALDALSLATGSKETIDRHPERRFKAAYAAYEERRIPELRAEKPGLRLGQVKELIRKEFEKSEENPFNKVGIVRFDASKEEVEQKRKEEKERVEERLAAGGK